MTDILIVPGLGGSGPEHWQTRWQRLDPNMRRVEQADWDAPSLATWVETLQAAVERATAPVVLVAHSLGVVLVAHWATRAPQASVRKIHGALLVAPPDVDATERMPACVHGFAPVPRVALAFPSIMVASRDDPYADIACPRALAEAWGARFVDVGAQGHINADSKLGDWPEGQALLRSIALR